MHVEVLDAKGREIFLRLKNFKDFYLAGGTALALQIGHRISVDFDLFSPHAIARGLLRRVKSVFTDRKVIVSVNNPEELTLFIGGKKVTFLKYPFPLVRKLVPYRGVRLLSVQEIAATKAYTIGRRGSYKDYVDLYFILRDRHASLPGIINLAVRKYRRDFNARLFLEQLLYLEDIHDTPVKFLIREVSQEQLEKFFTQTVKEMKL